VTVLVCTDFTDAASAGERGAAQRFPDAQLVIFHVVDTSLIARVVQLSGADEAELRSELTHYADLRLNEIVERMLSQGRKALAELASGDRVDAAVEAATRHRAELMVMGVPRAEGGLSRFRTGIARRSRIPVLIIPG
jgi:nucleotide-binding universal stress UspA family protein